MISKSNMKKLAVGVACLLLLIPVTVAQSKVQATAHCAGGELQGITVKIETPGTYTIMFGDDICDPPRRHDGVTT